MVRFLIGIVKVYWIIVSGFFKIFLGVATTVVLAPVLLFAALFLGGSIKIFGEERVFTALHWVGIVVGVIVVIIVLGSFIGDFDGSGGYGFHRY